MLCLCRCEASEKLLKTWQENEEKADGFMKVGKSLNTHHIFINKLPVLKVNAWSVFCCRLQMWGIWMKRWWLYTLRSWSCRGARLRGNRGM